MFLQLQNVAICFASSVAFAVLNEFSKRTIPSYARQNSKQIWRWKNIVTSLVHSVLTGFGAILCFVDLPKMAEDMIEAYTVKAHILITISLGYFIYDFLDMALRNRCRETCELMIHHIFVIGCFGISVVNQRFVGYALAALVVELNNMFLHSRQLLLMLKFSKSHPGYRLNSLINISTFIVFRMVTLAWMTRWLVINREILPLPEYTFGTIAMAVIVLMSIVLFFRLINSDFLMVMKRKNMCEHKMQ